MHCSAKRGIAIASRLSVSACLSVTLVDQDHIGRHRQCWKLIARTISQTPPLLVTLRQGNTQGNIGKFSETVDYGVEKSGVLKHRRGNIPETRKDRGKVTLA